MIFIRQSKKSWQLTFYSFTKLLKYYVYFPFVSFTKGETQTGIDFIQKGIQIKESVGVPLYVASGYCDLGSGY